jgi:DNA polymerase I-like protein with 3'-5' exonuclease and polymerase domains
MTQPALVTVDLETYYSREYSLTKFTTEEYIRSPQFEAIGAAFKLNDSPSAWVPKPRLENTIKRNDWSNKLVICQNTAFDGAILNWHYGVNPLAWIDIMGMSRALFPHERSHSLKAQAERMGVGVKGDEVLRALGKRYADFSESELAAYGSYCINDVDLTHTLFHKYMAMGFPKIELQLLDLTLRMFIDPVLVLDESMLRKHLTEVQDRKQELMESVRDMMLEKADPEYVHAIFSEGMAGIKKLLMSNEKFATLLRSFNVEPPLKVSPATGLMTYAFAKSDEAFKELAEHPDERVQTLAACRVGSKSTLEETRTQRFIGMAQRGAFPVPLRYYGAHSGRWSGQDSVNLQNLPSRGENANKIKKSMLAPPGYIVIDCDSAQIEARTLAWLAGQNSLVKAFEDKQDVYSLMAASIYGIPVDQVTTGARSQRQVGKTVILGAGYGVGAGKLQIFLKTVAGVEVTLDEAKRIVNTYRGTYPNIPMLWNSAQEALRALVMGNGMQVDAQGVIHAIPNKGLSLPNGLHIQYPELVNVYNEGKSEWVYTSKGVSTKIYGGKVVENFTQAVARCVVAEQMLKISKRYKVVLTVHDAVACIAPIEEAAEAKKFVEECMSWRPKWAQTLPLACESGSGASYGDC